MRENKINETLLVEQLAIKFLEDMGYKKIIHKTIKDKTYYYDILADGKKIDVKYSFPALINKKKKLPIWDFDLRKGDKKDRTHTNLDYFLCFGVIENIIKRAFFIPFKSAQIKHLRISIYGNSKWNSFLIWDDLR